MMKKKNIISLVLTLCLCFALAVPAFATDEINISDDEIDATDEISIVEASEVEQNLRSAVSDADMFVMTKSQSIPLYLEDDVSSEQIDKSEVQALLIEAENKSADTEDYNLYVIEDDLTYFYADLNGDISLSVFETQVENALVDNDTLMEEGINPLAYGSEKQNEFPNGIGCKAYTYSTKNTRFEATFYSDDIKYAGSMPNNGSDKTKMINLYNYLGNVETNGIATDLGVQYSATNSAWQPYFCHNGSTSVGGVMSGAGLYYKGTASAPATIAIDRYAQYNNLIRYKLTVSGKTTSNSNGQTVIFGGRYLNPSVSVQYKVVSTIGTTSLSNIKTGAGFNTYWTNIKINETPVNGYQNAYYWDGTISKLSSAGADFKLAKTNR